MIEAETEKLKEKQTENGIEGIRAFLRIRIFIFIILSLNLIEYAVLEIPKIQRQLIDLGISRKFLPAFLLTLIISKAVKILLAHVFIFIIIIDTALMINSNSYAISVLCNLFLRIK